MSASAPTSTSEAAVARPSLRERTRIDGANAMAEPKSLFENDLVLPSQGLRNSMAGGERELYSALLEGALLDMEGPPGRLQSDARAWLMSGNRGKVTFSQCCDWLRLDEGKVRKRALDGEFRFERRGGPPSKRQDKVRALEASPLPSSLTRSRFRTPFASTPRKSQTLTKANGQSRRSDAIHS
jgi:hypothetical protein